MSVRLPLFPLGSVLVPGLVMPLHIFEPRYRVLVEALMALPDGAPRHFGVVALRAGREVGSNSLAELHPVGCTAELREVTPYSDGRFDVVAVGETRFQISGLDQTAGTPYLTGLVDFLPEPDGDGDLPGLAGAVIRQFAAYRRQLGVEVTELPDDPRVVSYLVAAAAVLEVTTRQQLLEQPTTCDRLRHEVALLSRERALVKAFAALPVQDLGEAEGGLN